MMQQYQEAKEACGDALLFFRMGDFYELFFEDAQQAARLLGLTLTSRDKGSSNPIPMAGFPHHQLESYLAKLIRQGMRVAICEQMEDPRKAKGLVKRDIARVVTPGTLTDDGLLDPQESNYLSAVVVDNSQPHLAGLAWMELSTGTFQAATVNRDHLVDEIARVNPAECLIEEGKSLQSGQATGPVMTSRPAWTFSPSTATERLQKQFGTLSLEGFGFDDHDRLAIRAAGAILCYLHETQRTSLHHIDRLIPYRRGTVLEIDQATRRSLEITRSMHDGRREGSLLAVIDRTVTPMGARTIADWLNNPLTQIGDIEARLQGVAELVADGSRCERIRTELRGVYDLQRLLARVATGRASPRDLSFVGRTLHRLPRIKEALADAQSPLLRQLHDGLDLCAELATELSQALVDDCPLSVRDGGIIREAFHAQLDQLRELAKGGKRWLAEYQAEQQQVTGIANLKIGYTQVFGYYIEITNLHRDKVPDYFIRRQTLKNAERFVTEELKKYEEQVLTADGQAKDLEYELFVQMRERVEHFSTVLFRNAQLLAQLDSLAGLAELARAHDYCRPEPVTAAVLDIRDGRHPVLDITQPAGTFIPNDARAGDEDGLILLITGPNMAGKSTYIRQVALLTLMMQVGSFVPARQARIGVADRIFARVGASDQLARGHSTFMVEMTEAARILNTATPQSLVILDEIGRGTSTYDGVSLAWAIVEYLHDRIGCRTLFATHYHELTDLQQTLLQVRNLNVAVKEWEDHVVFLHKIVPGAADKSYGIHVARLAGVPREVNERAKQILSQLEGEHMDENGRPKAARRSKVGRRGELQLTLFGPSEHPLLDDIRRANCNELTPIQALQLIQSWQQELKREKSATS